MFALNKSQAYSEVTDRVVGIYPWGYRGFEIESRNDFGIGRSFGIKEIDVHFKIEKKCGILNDVIRDQRGRQTVIGLTQLAKLLTRIERVDKIREDMWSSKVAPFLSERTTTW